MKKIFLVIAVSSASMFVHAQDYIKYELMPKLHAITDSQKKYAAVYILKEKEVAYEFEKGNLIMEITNHSIIKVNDDKGIETFNTFSFALNGTEYTQMNARSIQPNGTVKDLPADKIKEQTLNDGRKVKLVALEGLEKGSEVEILTTEKLKVREFGSADFQSAYPIVQANFYLKCPEEIIFETKGYNGFPSAKDTNIDKIVYHQCSLKNIEAMESEEYGYYGNAQKRIDYRVSYTKNNPTVRVNTWESLVKTLYNNYYTFSEKEYKQIAKYLDKNDIKSDMADEDKIIKIEDLIKTKIIVKEEVANEDLSNIEDMLSKNITDKFGLMRLICGSFKLMDVPFELGVSSTKKDGEIDPAFENYNMLDEFLIYFPTKKKFISPASPYLRYPIYDDNAVGNNGIFCKILSVGGATSAKAQIRKIAPLPFESSSSDIDATISFTGPTLLPELDVTTSLSGLEADGLREVFLMIPEDKKKEIVKSIAQNVSTLDDIKEFNISNVEMNNYTIGKPLQIRTKFQAKELNGKAGNKYLFKLGLVIGAQNEMYKSEKKRMMPIEIGHPHSYNRKIVVNIPDGYIVKNPESIVIKKEQPTYGFVSSYELKGSQLMITITEYYKEIYHPKEQIDSYREVINAAADFNKVVLVFEKKP
jgi:Domain of Unknown Function with PDB structure (DUF3857)